MSHLIAARSRLPALLVAVLSVACGQATADPQATTQVSVGITVPPTTSQTLPPLSGSSMSSTPLPSVLALVRSVRLSVIDSANQPVMGVSITTVPISPGQTVSVTIEVLTGPARTFVGQAMDAQGTVLFQGRSSPVDLDGTPVSVGLAMTLNPLPLDLHVATSGTGSGTVMSNPPGIACSPPCSAPFTLGTTVTLTADADDTSTFIGWTGTTCSGTGTCFVTMDAAKTVTATFTKIQYTLDVTRTGTGGGTVSSAPAGLTCGQTCSAMFDAATTVTLTATPDPTSTFAGWAGACTGTGTCTVAMTAAKAVTATFTRIQYDLDVIKTGTGDGTVSSVPAGIACGATCSASSAPFDATSSVTLTAVPDATSMFAGWAGACTGIGTCTVAMTAAKTVAATFIRIPYALTVTKIGTGGGTVTSDPSGIDCGTTCAEPFDAATDVTLTATPDATSTFGGWTGCTSSTATTCTVTIDAAKAVTATFTRIQYALTVTPSGTGDGTVTSSPAGINCGSSCLALFDADSTVTLTADADDTSTFAGWAGAGCADTGTCIVTMTAAQAVTATFTRIQYPLSVTMAGTGGGTVTSSPEGIDCGTACAAPFDAASSVTLTAAPDLTSTFAGWTGCTSSTATTCTVTMTAAQAVTATFDLLFYQLSVTNAGGGVVTSDLPGVSCNPTCSASYLVGELVNLTASPTPGYQFSEWREDCTGSGPCAVTMTSNKSVTATFTQLPTPSINRLSLTHGVIGDTLKITGTDFGASPDTVTVGGQPAPIQRWSDGEIVALIPDGLSVSSAGIPYDVIVTGNGQQSDPAFITLFDRVLGVGGKNGETNFDQFVLQTDQVTGVVDILPENVDGGSSAGVAISADAATMAEADNATLIAQAASERVVSFNALPSVAPLTINAQQVNVYGQDIAVSGDGQVALIAAFIPGSEGVPVPALVRVTALDTLVPVSAELSMLASECVHEVALSADGDTAAVITGAIVDGCSSFSSPVRIYRIDNVLSSLPTHTEVTVLASSTTPPDRFTDLALSADGSTLIAGRIVLDADQNQWNAGILRVTGFKTTPVPHDDSNALALYASECSPATVDVDLSADGTTTIVGIVKSSDQLACPGEQDYLFQIRDADLGVANTPFGVPLPTAIGLTGTNLEGVALNSGGSIALVRTNLPETVLMRVDAFNTATPVPTNLPPDGSLADMNGAVPPRPQDYVDLQ